MSASTHAHPLYGKPYGDTDAELDVHGGLTYANKCSGTICHVPEPGMPDDVWWFGFDGAHAGDLAPGMIAQELKWGLKGAEFAGFHLREDIYRDVDYMRAETERLAEQLRQLAG